MATDTNLRIQFCNHAAGRIIGRPPEETRDHPIVTVIPADRQELVTGPLQRALHQGEVSEMELRWRDAAQQVRYLAVTISPIRVDDSEPIIGVSVYLCNITQQVELLRSIATTQKMAALGTMAGAVAHHFNNLLGGILTSIEYAETSNNPDILRRAVRAVAYSLKRANLMTLNLRTFAEGDHADSTAAEAADIVYQYMTTIESKLEDENIKLETDVQPLHLATPARTLMMILDALTLNARQAMNDGGTLRIELRPGRNNEIVLTVADTGIGIPEEHLIRAFEPFFTTKSGQTGLGLSVVYGLVKNMGGTVTLNRREPSGTVCLVGIPATEQLG